jgi:hypothetical protein
MDNNFKHAFMVFVFLFLVLVIIDPILVNAQTGSIFLTYKDPQDRFSISYPQGWDINHNEILLT